MRLRSIPLALMVLSACATPSMRPSASPAPATAPVPREIQWARTAAEHDALFVQIYRLAARRVEALAAGRAAGSWAVVLDADETVLDNSAYYRDRAVGASTQPPFDPVAWDAWVRRADAAALPGAAAFVARVRSLGGRVVIVTNRDEAVCGPTRANLTEVGLTVDAVLCRTPETGDKNPRFEAVRNGTAGMPPLDVLLWIGDNIQDFPGLRQDLRARGEGALTDFGVRWFLLPNPMYGSWEVNAPR